MRIRIVSSFAFVAVCCAGVSAQSIVQVWTHAASKFGLALAVVGDLDADGVEDVLVGADQGAYVLSGASGSVLRTIVAPAGASHFGHAAAALGDVNGDGVPDYAVGAPGWDGFFAPQSSCSVQIYSGADGGLVRTLDGAGASAFGFALASGADLDGDGVNELIVGAPRGGVNGRGLATVYSGASGAVLRVHDQAADQGMLGYAVAFFGDVTADGVDEYAVSRPSLRVVAGPDAGLGFVDAFDGASGALLWTAESWTGEAEEFGCAVTAGGHFYGDARRFVLVGAREATGQYAPAHGAVFLLDGATGHVEHYYTGPQNYAGSGWGQALAALDYDGDGKDDPVAAAPGLAPLMFEGSKPVRVLRGGGANSAPMTTLPIPSALQRFGHALAATDLDHDGLPELLVSIPGASTVRVYRMFQSPRRYCSAQVNSQGCAPTMTWQGSPSVSNPQPFTVGVVNAINNKVGFVFYSVRTLDTPFYGGVLCVGAPRRRTPIQPTGGNPPPDDCSGALAFDLNARIQNGLDPDLVAGAELFAQYWSRDPAFATHSNLSDALALRIGL